MFCHQMRFENIFNFSLVSSVPGKKYNFKFNLQNFLTYHRKGKSKKKVLYALPFFHWVAVLMAPPRLFSLWVIWSQRRFFFALASGPCRYPRANPWCSWRNSINVSICSEVAELEPEAVRGGTIF